MPARPRDTLRGLLVLQGLSREIERQAAALKAQQAALDQVSDQMAAAAPALAEAEAVQARQGAVLDAQIASAQASQQAALDAAAQAAKAAADDAGKAQDLRAVLRLAAGRQEEPTAAIIDSRTLRCTPRILAPGGSGPFGMAAGPMREPSAASRDR